MFSDAPILIVEDNLYLALDLSSAIEEMAGRVVGPASTIAEALNLLDRHEVAAAIVDCQFANDDVLPLSRRLSDERVPFLIHTANLVPNAFGDLHPDVPILIKPVQPRAILTCLLDEIRKSRGHEQDN